MKKHRKSYLLKKTTKKEPADGASLSITLTIPGSSVGSFVGDTQNFVLLHTMLGQFIAAMMQVDLRRKGKRTKRKDGAQGRNGPPA